MFRPNFETDLSSGTKVFVSTGAIKGAEVGFSNSDVETLPQSCFVT